MPVVTIRLVPSERRELVSSRTCSRVLRNEDTVPRAADSHAGTSEFRHGDPDDPRLQHIVHQTLEAALRGRVFRRDLCAASSEPRP
jgi:hypothetical protein